MATFPITIIGSALFNRSLSANYSTRSFYVYFALIIVSLFLSCKTNYKPMDINGQGRFDYNLFLENPNWQYKITNHVVPSVADLCPVKSDNPQDWINSPTCTSQYVYLNAAHCPIIDFNSRKFVFGGHMNWFPVKYEGTLYWSDHTTPGQDDDYNFKMCRNDRALYTVNNDFLQLEFDSDETVDNWDNTITWWNDFHHKAVDDSDESARKRVDGKFAITLGLIGIDGGHSNFNSEMHPVYGMFIHTKDDPNDDSWAFFIRNWGNEGWCSSNQENLYQKVIKVILPHENTDDVDLSKNNNVYFVNPDPSMSMSFEKCNEGVLLTFTFNNPEKKGCFVGDLGLVWKGTNLRPRGDFSQNPIYNPTESSPSSLVEPEFGDKTLIDKIDRLDKSSKNELKDLLSGRVISEKFPLLPRPKITRITEVSKTQPINLSESLHINYNKVPHTNLDSIKTEISKYKQNNTLPNYRDLVRSVPDPSTVLRKKMRQDLIINFLKSKGIE